MPADSLHENRLHGSLTFPFQHYTMAAEPDRIFVPCHWHDETEIVLMKHGQVELLLDGNKHVLSAGDIAFINSQQLHQYSSITSTALYYAYVFPLDALRFQRDDVTMSSLITPLCSHELGFPAILSPESPCFQEVSSLIQKIIFSSEKKEEYYQLCTKAYLYEIICLLARNGLLRQYPSTFRQSDMCRQILLYIQKHYSRRITVADISKELGMSPNYFSAYFSRHFEKSFIDFLIHYRIEKASEILCSSDISVTQAAMQTGFENISYFIKKFKEITGHTPAQYRRIYTSSI